MSVDAEVLVIGAGPAGISAATTAAMHGRRVLLLDDNPAPGGQIWRASAADDDPSEARRKSLLALRVSGAQVFTGWRVFDAPRQKALRALEDSAAGPHTTDITYEQLILTTGARERFLPFPGWTLPGVFGAGGLQALARGGFRVDGKRIVVAGTGPLLLAVASHLRQMGGRVATVAEQASRAQLARFTGYLSRSPRKLLEGLQYRAATGGSKYRAGCWPLAALGEAHLTGVRLTDGVRIWDEPCDLLACGFHLTPNTELASLLDCRLCDSGVGVDDLQQTSVAGILAAGEACGIAGLDAALLTGTIAGLAAAGAHDKASALAPRLQKARDFARRLESAFALRPEVLRLAQPDTIVCRCEDVAYGALAEYGSWNEAKRQTRCGMGACQGRVCGPAMQTLLGWRDASVRPPLFPVPISAFAVDSNR